MSLSGGERSLLVEGEFQFEIHVLSQYVLQVGASWILQNGFRAREVVN